MRRRLVWIQGGSVYQMVYGFEIGGIFPFVSRHTVSGVIELANPVPAFDQTFGIGTQGQMSGVISFLENAQGRMAATITGGASGVSSLRFYSARNELSVDISLRLEQLSSTDNPSTNIFARAFTYLARTEPAPGIIVPGSIQEIFVYGNDPVGTVRTWSGTISSP